MTWNPWESEASRSFIRHQHEQSAPVIQDLPYHKYGWVETVKVERHAPKAQGDRLKRLHDMRQVEAAQTWYKDARRPPPPEAIVPEPPPAPEDIYRYNKSGRTLDLEIERERIRQHLEAKAARMAAKEERDRERAAAARRRQAPIDLDSFHTPKKSLPPASDYVLEGDEQAFTTRLSASGSYRAPLAPTDSYLTVPRMTLWAGSSSSGRTRSITPESAIASAYPSLLSSGGSGSGGSGSGAARRPSRLRPLEDSSVMGSARTSSRLDFSMGSGSGMTGRTSRLESSLAPSSRYESTPLDYAV